MKRKEKFLSVVCLMAVVVFILAGSGVNSSASAAETAGYPNGPIRVIVARAAGGSNDATCRTIQPFFQKYLGVPVVVENVPGAGGQIGTKQVYDAAPDGYTLLYGTAPTDILGEVVDGAPYEMLGFTQVFNVVGYESNIIFTSADSGIETLEQLIEKAKTEGISLGKMTGISIPSLAVSYLVTQTGLSFDDITYIPYEGNSEIVTAVMGGHIDIGVSLPPGLVELERQGKIRVLCGFYENRSDVFPNAPAFSELYPGNYYYALQGFQAPPGTPKEIIDVLGAALEKAVADPEFLKIASGQFNVQPMHSAEFRQAMTDFQKTAVEMKQSLLDLEKSGQQK